MLKLTTLRAPREEAQEHPEEAPPGPHEEGLRWAEENAIFVDELPAFRNEDQATVAWTLVNYAKNMISMVSMNAIPKYVYIFQYFSFLICIYVHIGTTSYRCSICGWCVSFLPWPFGESVPNAKRYVSKNVKVTQKEARGKKKIQR